MVDITRIYEETAEDDVFKDDIEDFLNGNEVVEISQGERQLVSVTVTIVTTIADAVAHLDSRMLELGYARISVEELALSGTKTFGKASAANLITLGTVAVAGDEAYNTDTNESVVWNGTHWNPIATRGVDKITIVSVNDEAALGGGVGIDISGSRLATAAPTANALALYDISAGATPQFVTSHTTGMNGVNVVKLKGELAYTGSWALAETEVITAVDFREIDDAVNRSAVLDATVGDGVLVGSNFITVDFDSAHLIVTSTAKPDDLKVVLDYDGSVDGLVAPTSLAADRGLLAVTNFFGSPMSVHFYKGLSATGNVDDPLLEYVGKFTDPNLDRPFGVAMRNGLALATSNNNNRLFAIDYTTPTAPVRLDDYEDLTGNYLDEPTDVQFISNDRALVLSKGDFGPISLWDISDPTDLKPLAFIKDADLDGARYMKVSGNYVYVMATFAHKLVTINLHGTVLKTLSVGAITADSIQVASAAHIGSARVGAEGLLGESDRRASETIDEQKTGGNQSITVTATTDTLVTGLSLTLPDKPGHNASVVFSPTLKVDQAKKTMQFVFYEDGSPVESTRASSWVSRDDTETKTDWMKGFFECLGQTITVYYVSDGIGGAGLTGSVTTLYADGADLNTHLRAFIA